MSSVLAAAKGTDMATNAASPYRRRRTHASTTAAAIAVIITSPPGQTSTASSVECPLRVVCNLASTTVSTQPGFHAVYEPDCLHCRYEDAGRHDRHG